MVHVFADLIKIYDTKSTVTKPWWSSHFFNKEPVSQFHINVELLVINILKFYNIVMYDKG